MTKNARLSGRFNEITGALEAIKQGGQAIDLELSTLGGGVPNGGTAGQTLVKNSGTNGDASWAAVPSDALKANLASPAFTGSPTAPTAAPGTNNTQISTTAFVMVAIANLIASSPAALDTLNELATALGNDANFATTVTNALALKAPLASPTLTGNLTLANPTGYTKATTINVWLTQDATGSRTLTLGAKFKKGIGMDLTLSTTASAVDFLSLVYNPTKDIWIASLIKGVA